MKDSIIGQQVLLTGNASDDYGISRLYFHYTVVDAAKQVVSEKNIPYQNNQWQCGALFQQYFDFGSLTCCPARSELLCGNLGQ